METDAKTSQLLVGTDRLSSSHHSFTQGCKVSSAWNQWAERTQSAARKPQGTKKNPMESAKSSLASPAFTEVVLPISYMVRVFILWTNFFSIFQVSVFGKCLGSKNMMQNLTLWSWRLNLLLWQHLDRLELMVPTTLSSYFRKTESSPAMASFQSFLVLQISF